MNNKQKKQITLQEAAKMTPYSADYLGLLIRKNRLEGFKEKGKWYTTQQAVESYLKKVAAASYAHQENLKVEVPAEKIKIASVNFRWSMLLAAVIFAGAVMFGAYSWAKSKEDSLCNKYKVKIDEKGNLSVVVPRGENIKTVNVVQGE